jgi:hypothetical protein
MADPSRQDDPRVWMPPAQLGCRRESLACIGQGDGFPVKGDVGIDLSAKHDDSSDIALDRRLREAILQSRKRCPADR